MPRGRSQIPYYGQCPENDMIHLQRASCYGDNYKMELPCGLTEFKSPLMANPDPPPPPPKKKRRTSSAVAAANQTSASPTIQDLLPPPLSGYGDTIVASNPFDDTPPHTPSMNHMNSMTHLNKHMQMNPCMSPASIMGSVNACQMVGSPMNCGPVGSPMNCGPPMGSCSPMGGGSNVNCGPIGSPHGSCTSRQVSRSPLVCPPMSSSGNVMNCGPPNSSPLNVTSVHPINRSPSLGSPLSSVMAPNVRGNSPLDCGLGITSVGSQKGSPMSVMSSHSIGNLNCGSPMGSPVTGGPLSCNNGSMNIGSPITSPLGNVPCSMTSEMNLNVMNRSPMNVQSNSIGSPMMCGSSMRGPSPINSGPAGSNSMNMNCNTNSGLGMGMVSKADLGLNDMALRDSCAPSHMSMKQSMNANMGMAMGNMQSGRSDMSNLQCGPGMNNQHCVGSMMNSMHCNPSLNSMQCMGIGSGMNRVQCGPSMSMGNNMAYDPSNVNAQCRTGMNRSQYNPRAMGNMQHFGANSMNNICPSDMGSLSCGINTMGNLNCGIGGPMNNAQCMSSNAMNMHCSVGNTMYNSQYGSFDNNSARCSPSPMHCSAIDMGMNSNFYRHGMSAMQCMSGIGSVNCSIPGSGNDLLSSVESMMDVGKLDGNGSLGSNLCGIGSRTDDVNDDFNSLIDADNFIKEISADGVDGLDKSNCGSTLLGKDCAESGVEENKDIVEKADGNLSLQRGDVCESSTDVQESDKKSVGSVHSGDLKTECEDQSDVKEEHVEGASVELTVGETESKSDEVEERENKENDEKNNEDGGVKGSENETREEKPKEDELAEGSKENMTIYDMEVGRSPSAAEQMACVADVLASQGMECTSAQQSPPIHYGNNRPIFGGKVYPIGKSKIYNSQNPNAPPNYVCGGCHREVNDNLAILCESGCNFFYHRECAGLTEAAFQMLEAEVYAEWVCDKCLSSKNVPLVKLKP